MAQRHGKKFTIISARVTSQCCKGHEVNEKWIFEQSVRQVGQHIRRNGYIFSARKISYSFLEYSASVLLLDPIASHAGGARLCACSSKNCRCSLIIRCCIGNVVPPISTLTSQKNHANLRCIRGVQGAVNKFDDFARSAL